MILVAYDGSADAMAAIDRVADVMPGAAVTVLTVWEPFAQTVVRTTMGMGVAGYSGADSERVDDDVREAAQRTAAEGAERATAAGLVAQPRIEMREGDIATAILTAAKDLDADIIALGTRGRGGLKAFLLGSVSHAVSQHADGAVLIVPSPDVAQRRREHVHHHPAHA